MDVISPEKRLQTEIKKLNREIKRLKKDNEVLRIANDQASRTQAYIQKDSTRQVFYNNQLLKTYPYLLILTDEKLLTVMISDMFFRYSSDFDREEVRRGVPLREILSGVLPKYDLAILLEKCSTALAGLTVPSYLMRSVVNGKSVDWRITIKRMEKEDGGLAGLKGSHRVVQLQHLRGADGGHFQGRVAVHESARGAGGPLDQHARAHLGEHVD